MTADIAPIPEADGVDIRDAVEFASAQSGPVVFRGVAGDWPLVRSSLESSAAASRYLLEFYDNADVTAFVGKPEIGGRIFYTDDLADTNFEQIRTRLTWLLDQLRAHEDDPAPPTFYMGSTAMDYCLPGLREANRLPLGEHQATVRIWIGNRTTVAAHFDALDNIACVCAGRRRFTLFPPDQLANLYVGPIDFTPAGQSVSLVDLERPDFDRYPRFAEALANARTAVLEPGDAVYVPCMWWHHVQGLERFNILINHWWRDCPSYLGAPGDALLHAILSIRDLPREQRQAWRAIFDHYVFERDARSLEHIPEARRGALGELDEQSARQIRALLRTKLNR